MGTFSGIPGVGSTSVPQIQFTPQGPIVPPDVDILAGAQIDLNYAFGGGVNPALETPQGQIASSEAAIISDKDGQIVFLVNQFDPKYASGRFQDALGRIYFLERKPAAPTVVTCNVGGLVNTPIPAGTLAQDTAGNTYVLLGDVTIPASGVIASTWANLLTGPIVCLAGTLTRVYQAIPGWDTITNPTDGALGRNVESRAEFEFRRKNSVALNSRGTVESIYANVFDVDNVLDCYVTDNPKGFTVNKGSTNYPLGKNSLYVAVLGGTNAEVAKAIWLKKDPGCDYNGNTTYNVVDTNGYSYPYPTYPVSFERPAPLPILFAVQVADDPSLPANTEDLIKQAIIARFYGTDDTSRERIGSTILAARYYSAVASINLNLVLLGIEVGTSVANQQSVPVGIDQYPSLEAADITVTFV